MSQPLEPPDGSLDPEGGDGAPVVGGFDVGDLLSQALDMQRQMAEAQEQLGHSEVVGEAGGGLVRVVLTGHFEVRSVHLDPSVVDPTEADLLADLVTAALRNALDGVMDLQAARMNTGMPDLGGLLEDLGDLGGILGGGGPMHPDDGLIDVDEAGADGDERP
jgi:DNA-binding YbaB/EbfC family protein